MKKLWCTVEARYKHSRKPLNFNIKMLMNYWTLTVIRGGENVLSNHFSIENNNNNNNNINNKRNGKFSKLNIWNFKSKK